MKSLLICVSLAVFGTMPMAVASQGLEDIFAIGAAQATAYLDTSLNVEGVRDLDFGSVPPNAVRTVNVTDLSVPGAGVFYIAGQPGAEVSLELTDLPDELIGSGLFARPRVPISYTAAYNDVMDPEGAIEWPVLGVPAFPPPTLNATTGELYVFVGGTVTTAIDQELGNYEEKVVLEVAYTSN